MPQRNATTLQHFDYYQLIHQLQTENYNNTKITSDGILFIEFIIKFLT